jgi:hypothetical protein
MGEPDLITCGSSSSSGWLKMGVLENVDGCGRGAKGGAAPKVGFEGGDIGCYAIQITFSLCTI